MIAVRSQDDQDLVQRDLVIGVDVGGTTIKAALSMLTDLEYGSSERPTPRHLGPTPSSQQSIDAIVDLQAQVPEAGATAGGRPCSPGWSWTRGTVSPFTPRTSAGSSCPYARWWRMHLVCR